jgi:hypothetical protein
MRRQEEDANLDLEDWIAHVVHRADDDVGGKRLADFATAAIRKLAPYHVPLTCPEASTF